MTEPPGGSGDAHALLQLAYAEMRAIAERLIHESSDSEHLSPSSLVHLASMRLMNQRTPIRDARHMLALSVIAMRRLLVDQARARQAARRGGGSVLRLDAVEELADEPRFADALALDEALSRLAQAQPRGSEVVQARVFGGLSIEETAASMGISEAQVKRDWQAGIAWLREHWSDRRPDERRP
jgi:RNA polymerase sigma factor (TIGR02999 family)